MKQVGALEQGVKFVCKCNKKLVNEKISVRERNVTSLSYTTKFHLDLSFLKGKKSDGVFFKDEDHARHHDELVRDKGKEEKTMVNVNVNACLCAELIFFSFLHFFDEMRCKSWEMHFPNRFFLLSIAFSCDSASHSG